MIVIAALVFMALLLTFVAVVHVNDRRKLRAFAGASSFKTVPHSATAPRQAFTIEARKG